MKKRLSMVLLMVAIMSISLLAGCQTVYVKNQQGESLRWAEVAVTDQKGVVQGTTYKTGMMGEVMIPSASGNDREYLQVSKDGYTPRRMVRPKESSITVPLQKAPGRRDAKTEK